MASYTVVMCKQMLRDLSHCGTVAVLHSFPARSQGSLKVTVLWLYCSAQLSPNNEFIPVHARSRSCNDRHRYISWQQGALNSCTDCGPPSTCLKSKSCFQKSFIDSCNAGIMQLSLCLFSQLMGAHCRRSGSSSSSSGSGSSSSSSDSSAPGRPPRKPPSRPALPWLHT